jgi:hypothetical protein
MSEIAQPKWAVWRKKQKLEASTPDSFQALIAQCSVFADPVLSRSSIGHGWTPQAMQWHLLPNRKN